MSDSKVVFMWLLIVTSVVNLVLALILLVEAEKKEWPIFMPGATLVALVSVLTLGTACFNVEWTLWTVAIMSVVLSIYFAVMAGVHANTRFPKHEERLWRRSIYTGAIRAIEKEHQCCGKKGPPFYCYHNRAETQNNTNVWRRGCFWVFELKSEEFTALLVNYMIAIIVFEGLAAIALAIVSLKRRKKAKKAALAKRMQRERERTAGRAEGEATSKRPLDNKSSLATEDSDLSRSRIVIFDDYIFQLSSDETEGQKQKETIIKITKEKQITENLSTNEPSESSDTVFDDDDPKRKKLRKLRRSM